MPAVPAQIARHINERARSAAYAERTKGILLDMAAVNTAPRTEAAELRAAENQVFDLIRQEVRAVGTRAG